MRIEKPAFLCDMLRDGALEFHYRGTVGRLLGARSATPPGLAPKRRFFPSRFLYVLRRGYDACGDFLPDVRGEPPPLEIPGDRPLPDISLRSREAGALSDGPPPDCVDERADVPNNESVSPAASRRAITFRKPAAKTSGESASGSFRLDLPGKSIEPVVFPLLKPEKKDSDAAAVAKAKPEAIKSEKAGPNATESPSGIRKKPVDTKRPALEGETGGTTAARGGELRSLIGLVNAPGDAAGKIELSSPLPSALTPRKRREARPDENQTNDDFFHFAGALDNAVTKPEVKKRIAPRKKGRPSGGRAEVRPKDEPAPGSRERVIVIAPRRKANRPPPAFWERNYFHYFRFISFR